MTKMNLFGLTLPVPYDGPIGGLANNLKMKLSTDNKRISIAFSGVHPFGKAAFDVVLDCKVENDLVKLLPTAEPVVASLLEIQFPLSLGLQRSEPAALFVMADGNLVWIDSDSFLRPSLRNVAIINDLEMIDWNARSEWSSFLIAIDIGSGCLLFYPFPGGPSSELLISDDFLKGFSYPIAHREQVLSIQEVTATFTSIEVAALAPDGMLLIHPDILATAASVSEQDNFQNDLLYQHALVNGSLRLKFTGDKGSVRVFEWAKRPGQSRPPSMLAFRLTDEHGHPLLVELAGGCTAFRLSQRFGTQVENSDGTEDKWELTNPALVVYQPDQIDVAIHSIDPKKVGLRSKDYEKRWLSEGDWVEIYDHAPIEVHGLAQGTFLRRIDPNITAIKYAKLVTEAIPGAGFPHIFTKSELRFPIKDKTWQLVTQLEERDVVPGETGEPARVGHRVAVAKASEIRLPLIDTSYALANLADPGGRVKANCILNATIPWLGELDKQFAGDKPTHFDLPTTEVETHISGFAIAPTYEKGPYAGILDMPPGSAKRVGDTARTGSEMKQQELLYVHGGERAVGKVGELAKALQSSVTDFIPQFKKFESFWNSLDLNGKPAEARAALRRFMGLDRYTKDSKPIELGRSELERLRITTLEILSGAQLITVPEQAAVEELRGMRDEINTVDGFKEWWSKPSSARIRALLDLVWSGTGPSIYRRAYDAVRKEIPPELSAYAIELKANILKFTPPSFPNQLLPGFPTPSYLGMDEAVDILTDMWANLPGLDELRARFGAALTPDVYRTLLAQHDVLISVLREYFVSDRFKSELFNHGFDALRTAIITRWDHSSVPELVALHKKYGDWKDDFFKRTLDASERLKLFEAVVTDVINFYSKLRFDPPEYLFFSSRVQMSVSDKVKEFVERLWSQKFRLASLGDKNFWSFLLDSESSIIVKLNGTRSVDDIVREVDNAYSTDVKSNPLGLPGELSDKSKGLNDFLDRLDPAIRSVQWRGVLIIRPTADISNDTQLANLTGISDFPMVYAAIGGSKPELTGESLDVYANIYRERMPLNVEGTPPEDLTFTLIKFDATIRNTRLVAGEVIFRFDIRNVFGRDTTDNTKFPVLMLRGALPRDKKADANSFEFSGWFEKPIRYPAQDPENKGLIAFIRAVVFKTLRVSTNRGQTAVDIDAELLLKPWDVELAGQSFHVGPDTGKDATLNLQNFRILLPSLPSGASIPFGLPRLLNFELPAIAFNWPSPRPLNLWDGIELLPIGMGFIRRVAEAKDAFQRFRDRYRWIGEIQPPEGIFQLPYLRCSIHFGKLPFLGGTNLSRLNLELVIAAVIEAPGKSPTIRIGIGDIDGRDISIDLFGLIKLEIEKMILARFTTSDSKQAVTLSVKNPRLTICGWSPLAKSDQFQFLLANAEGRTDGRAALGFYTHDPGENGFFRLYWLLIAHNLKLKNELIGQYLMSDAKPEDAHHLLDHFVDTEKKEIQAQILEDDSWLLGASFALGKIVERGTLIMHDQHYYGIALRGEPIKKMFGVNRLELAYICGQTRAQDRFRACFRLAALDFIGSLRSGDIAIEWGFNWDFLLDFGFPWKSGAAYLWERAFSLPMGSYEVKFGLYCEKRTQMTPSGAKELTLSAGVGFYFGYYIGFGTPGRFVWAQAGIGVFAILEGSIRFELPAGGGGANLIKGTIREVMVRGVIGIFAYGEGGIEIWVISARFRVSVQAAIAGEFHYLPGASSCLRYAATLYAGYSASCRVGSGWFSFTFEVSGSIEMQISGQALLN